jgi:tetratricopeptide (TPR) repeat protein
MKYRFTLLWICLGIGSGFSQVMDPELNLRQLLLEEGYEELIEATGTFMKVDSLIDLACYYRGRAYQSLFNYDSAFFYYRQASILDTGNVSCRIRLGEMLAKLGRNREAVEVYEGLRSGNHLDKQHIAELANLYSLRNDNSRGRDIYLGLLETDSLNYYFLKQAGKCYLELDRKDSALICFEAAFRQNPADVYLTYQIASIYLGKKDLENALYSIQKGFVYDTGNLDLLKLRGYLWLLSGEYQRAIGDLENARLQDPRSVFIQKYLGISYHEEKRFEEAREALRLGFQLDSTDAEIAYFLGSACRWSKFEEEGVFYYKKSIELRQPDPKDLKNVYIQLAELLKVLHRFDEALDSYGHALEMDPEDNTLYFKIGQVYDQNLNRKKTAIEYYGKYLSEGSTDQQLFNAGEGTSRALEQHVRERINTLKEQLFMEDK